MHQKSLVDWAPLRLEPLPQWSSQCTRGFRGWIGQAPEKCGEHGREKRREGRWVSGGKGREWKGG